MKENNITTDAPRIIVIRTFRNMTKQDMKMGDRSFRQNSIMAAPTVKPALKQNAQAITLGVTNFLPISIIVTKSKVGRKETT